MTATLWLGLALLGGALLTALGIWQVLAANRLAARGLRAEGRYIDATWATTAGFDATQYGRIVFRTRDGRDIVFEGRLGTPLAARHVGQPVPVIYDPARPDDAVVDTPLERWGPALILLATGAGLLASGPLVVIIATLLE